MSWLKLMKQKLVIENIITGGGLKYNWVFNGNEWDSGHYFIVPVLKRESQTLLATIRNWIRPGNTVANYQPPAIEAILCGEAWG